MKPTSITAALALAATALAESPLPSPPTRDTYKAQVEPICKTNQEASNRDLTGVKELVRNDKLKQAGERFQKAASALEKAKKQLARVPQPEADSAKLGRWLSDIEGEVSLMKTIGAKFRADDKAKASSLVVKLTHNANLANNLVIAFGFNYCRIDPSRYT